MTYLIVTQYTPLTTNPNEEPNLLAQLMDSASRRRRHVPGGSSSAASSVADRSTIPTSNVVAEGEISREARLRTHVLTTARQVMAVRFDLGASSQRRSAAGVDGEDGGGEGAGREYLDICVVKYGANGVLEMSPDFTHSAKPYRIEAASGVSYEYWLEHDSPTMQYDEQLQEALMLNDVYARLAQQRRADVGEDFEKPPKRTFRLVLNGEIVSAQDFEYDGLFVHYFVELPLGWSATSESQLMGMSHRCHTTADPANGKDMAHFSHTFNVDLFFDINRFDLDQESLPKWPQLFFEVVSVDSWSRVRAEGYGFTSVPYGAGCHDVTLPTWRPLRSDGSAAAGELRRYFVGGSPELEDLAYAGTPGDVADGKILSRFGFRTVNSGSIRVRMNIMHQSEAFLNEKTKRPMMTVIDKLTTATLFSSVSTVLEAFQKAREKVARATEGYDLNLAQENAGKDK